MEFHQIQIKQMQLTSSIGTNKWNRAETIPRNDQYLQQVFVKLLIYHCSASLTHKEKYALHVDHNTGSSIYKTQISA